VLFAFADPWLVRIAMARLLVEVLVDENELLAADLRDLATGSALAPDLPGPDPACNVVRVAFASAKPCLARIAMARLLVAVLVDENGLLAAGLHDPAAALGLAPGLHASALVARYCMSFGRLLSRGWPG
jgi:hypothetical protein